ncbi:hypothetical protein, variant 1 [Aphanomyces invadans]|uniref:HAD hydrolase, family IA n=1 Tax=Aphanomyces invadans TaxID=157072 RepID=A0A024TE15_9STRA|nr:hypothetical protein, variant 1 [Aphanomyces invadans]ETV92288.1 hypothetical protein, variant 1 [Aphanomyces invadans]|eukprot:XP_008879039.1 hypothetical protein, variant 1 [Aphanomyces invadans]
MPSLENGIRGVTFDLDDTLWCGKETLRRAAQVFHEHLERSYPLITQSLFETTWASVMAASAMRDFTALRQDTLIKCARSVGYEQLDNVVATSMHTFLAARSSPVLFEGVERVLQRLQMRLGVITNGNCQRKYLPPILRGAFGDVWVAPDSSNGYSKPHRVLFERALSLLKLDASHVVHVGDDYICDITGAKAVGMRTIWITSDPVDASMYPDADAIVRSIAEIIAVLETWSNVKW